MRRFSTRLNDQVDLGVLIALALLLCVIGGSRLIYPFDVGHFEACTWTPASLSAQGQNPYAYATREPFVMAPYGYFYYLVVGLGLRAFGWQFWFGRALTVLSAAVCVVCVASIARAVTSDRRALMLGGLSFLSTITLFHWIAVHRPDLPALALAFAALALVFTERETRDRIGPRTLVIIALLTLAFFFKQTTLLPIVVAIARYLQTGKIKVAAAAMCGVALSGAIVAAALDLTSGGGYFWQHLTLAGRIPQSYADAMRWLFSLCKSPSFWIAFGLIGAAMFDSARGIPPGSRVSLSLRAPDWLVYGYLIVAFIFGFVTSARRGAYINYYLEASMVGAIAVSLAWHRLASHEKWRRLYPAMAVLMLLAGTFEFSRMARAESYRWRSLPYYREVVATLEREVPADGLCVSVHPELAVAAGRKFHFGDWIQYQDGRSAELQEVFAGAVASKRYAAIVWLTPNVTELPGYRLLPMKERLPDKHYPLFVYLLDSRNAR